MRSNTAVTKINAGETAYGFYLSFPSTTIIELLSPLGFDYVHFDGEHGPFTPDVLDELCRVADGFGLTPMARVPDIEAPTVLRFLDRGIMGVTGPHVTTRDRAQKLADACRYAPLGKRSFGSGRGAHFANFPPGAGYPEYMAHFNEQVIVVAQLEDIEVLDDIDGILAVEGIDYYASGAQDIAQSLGLPGQPEHPKVLEFQARVRDAVHAAGKKMVDEVMVDVRIAQLIHDGARSELEALKAN